MPLVEITLFRTREFALNFFIDFIVIGAVLDGVSCVVQFSYDVHVKELVMVIDLL